MDREQFIHEVETTQRAFRRFLVALCCGDTVLADDIAQESYLKAYVACEGVRDVGKFKSWLFRIGYTTYLNHLRSLRPFEDVTEAVGVASDAKTDGAFEYQALHEALSQLPTKERSIVLLFYMEGYSGREIASIVGTSEGNVKQLLSRARAHLRGLLSHP